MCIRDRDKGAKNKTVAHEVDRLYSLLQLQSAHDSNEFSDALQRIAEAIRGKSVESLRAAFDVELCAMIAARRNVQDAEPLPEYVEEEYLVSEWSTIRVRHCAYSVPSRLMGHGVVVRIYEDRIEARFAGTLELACERLRGRNLRRIDYRHIIWSLVRKPGGFARYVYREEMFPSLSFRRAYDAIQSPHHGTKGDLEYLRVLHLAASTIEAEVEAALELLLAEGRPITSDAVKAIMGTEKSIDVPELEARAVELGDYDSLLREGALSEVGT